MKQLIQLDIGVYSNIISHFDNIHEINNFFNSDESFQVICTYGSFWSEMLKQRFDGYYLVNIHSINYNWKAIYLGLLHLRNRDFNSWINEIIVDYFEMFKYLNRK